MPIKFLNNYPENNLDKVIVKKDGSALNGEIWLYQQMLNINNQVEFHENDEWYFYHNYNLSKHPGSKGKVEGQIDFLLLNRDGLIVIEVKGGSVKVENGCFYSFKDEGFYKAQNPFIQAKEYVRTLKDLIGNSKLFICKAIVFPHTNNFQLVGPELGGYKHCFYSYSNYINLGTDFAKTESFYKFLNELVNETKKVVSNSINAYKGNNHVFNNFPRMSLQELRRIKNQLFPNQAAYSYNVDTLNSELILNTNYDILKGLKKNRRVLIQGKPGTGKTVLALKVIAENYLNQKTGVIFCANLLVKRKIEHLLISEYRINSSYISFEIFSKTKAEEYLAKELDYFIFDEAQEYFDEDFYEYVNKFDKKNNAPAFFILYDIDQTILSDTTDLGFYEDYFIQDGFSHYFFDNVFRTAQHPQIYSVCNAIKRLDFEFVNKELGEKYFQDSDTIKKLEFISRFIKNSRVHPKDKVILIEKSIYDGVKELLTNYFDSYILELSENNINVFSEKIKFTTPIKYRGLENEDVLLISSTISDLNRTQLYIGSTRAMSSLNVMIWS
ncbi:NERD domain-containing protein [Sphingobacterium sp.]|uniref:nuclease-related domain-containing protein n=1 Tax=Sphingobacterium sp. TaxID=341027 RepID=UPI0028ABAAD5|nr:NERD domain-containing protein [Sphingobacterium sp.]